MTVSITPSDTSLDNECHLVVGVSLLHSLDQLAMTILSLYPLPQSIPQTQTSSHLFPVHPCGEEDDVAGFTNQVIGNEISFEPPNLFCNINNPSLPTAATRLHTSTDNQTIHGRTILGHGRPTDPGGHRDGGCLLLR